MAGISAPSTSTSMDACAVKAVTHGYEYSADAANFSVGRCTSPPADPVRLTLMAMDESVVFCSQGLTSPFQLNLSISERIRGMR